MKLKPNVPLFTTGSRLCDIQIMEGALLRQVLQPLVRDRSSAANFLAVMMMDR
jgi:hypothetical protein